MTTNVVFASGKKVPISALVVIYSPQLNFLMLERADKPDYWQSVTGSLDTPDEKPIHAAVRELQEETGLKAIADAQCAGLASLSAVQIYQPGFLRTWPKQTEYEILSHWRHRYPQGVTHNTEHWFFVCVSEESNIVINPREHVQHAWLNATQASSICFSPSNAQAIAALKKHLATF